MLHPPASKNDILTYEEKIGRPFPPSYQMFLSLHNGWEKFENVYTLIGVSGSHTSKALAAIDYTIGIYRKKWEERFGALTEDKLKEFESQVDLSKNDELDAHIYLPHMLHFGTDFAGNLYYFYPHDVGQGGEMQVIRRGQTGRLMKRYPDFMDFLRSKLALTQKQL